jgi:hypothetical protein
MGLGRIILDYEDGGLIGGGARRSTADFERRDSWCRGCGLAAAGEAADEHPQLIQVDRLGQVRQLDQPDRRQPLGQDVAGDDQCRQVGLGQAAQALYGRDAAELAGQVLVDDRHGRPAPCSTSASASCPLAAAATR